jgi:hypothetical protein
MNTVLTLCSANYLAHAKVLGQSLAASNPDCRFVVGLVDRAPPHLDLAAWLPFEVLPVADLGLPEFPAMAERYNLVELNTAVKPFYLEFLYERDPALQSAVYLDPDILVLGRFDALAEKLKSNNIVLTPHSSTYDDSRQNIHYEICMLSTGVYNLGFIATRRSETTAAFLKWWQKRLVNHCYYRTDWGAAFVDQQWIVLAPLYFDGVHVEKDPGYNMSYWNHFERRLSPSPNGYLVNGQHELIFHHFSNFNPLRPDVIARRNPEHVATFATRPDLKPLYDDYARRLLAAGYESVRGLKCCYGRKDVSPVPTPQTTLKTRLEGAVRRTLGFHRAS